MVKKFAVLFVVFILQFLFVAQVFAGFGITPPYVKNTSLTRNSTYQQEILLVRSDPDRALNANITVDAPEFADWITIAEGNKILLPQGEQKVPMTVQVRVPDNADFKDYSGVIRIKTSRADGDLSSGSVNISLGAQVDIDLTVIDREIKNFRVRRIDISDLNEGHKWGWLYFPGKIRFSMLVENTGNVDVAPSKVVFRIYDTSGTVLLEETKNSNRMHKIEPFATEDIRAELPTRLPAGGYLARYQIYNGEDIKQEGELTLSILPYGTLQAAGYGFLGLSIPHMISIILPILTLIVIVGSLVYTSRRKRQREGV